MKKLLLIAGIIVLIACALSLAFAVLNLFGYHHVLDGSPELYDRLHQRMTAFFIAGAVLAAVGTVCIILHFKI